MAEQVVSFIANKSAPPTAEARFLRLFQTVMILPWLITALYLAVMCAGFLMGSAATWLGRVPAFCVGFAAAPALGILPIAIGLTWAEWRAVSFMAIVMFFLCLWLALMSAGGFAYFTSQTFAPHEEPIEFAAEPRQLAGIERAIQRFQDKVARARAEGRRFWAADEEWDRLQREKAARQRLDGISGSFGRDDLSAMFSPEALAFGRYFSAGYSHYMVVAFVMTWLTITAVCIKILTPAPLPVPVAPPASMPPANGADAMEKGFANWESACLLKEGDARTPAEAAFAHYQLWARSRNFPTFGDVAAFGRKMSEDGGPLARRGAFAWKQGGKMVYVNVRIRDDEFTSQIANQESGA